MISNQMNWRLVFRHEAGELMFALSQLGDKTKILKGTEWKEITNFRVLLLIESKKRKALQSQPCRFHNHELCKMEAQLTLQDRIWWGQVSHGYYLGGRILILNKQLDLGFILLGYAIEVYLKQGLLESGFSEQDDKKGLLKSHKLRKLFDKCRSRGIYKDVHIPSDFLEYADLLLNWRYPSQINKSADEASQKDKTISKEFAIIHCYDEVIHRLDKALFNFTGDQTSSAIYRICVGIDREPEGMGLYYNAAVLKDFEHYKELVFRFAAKNEQAIDLLKNKDAKFFWAPESGRQKVSFDLDLSETKLQQFKLPGHIKRDASGRPTIISFTSPFSASSKTKRG
ncbi:MAG: hypothetical protein ACK5W1_13330 [Flavobacteriales bacterium]